MLNPFFLWNIDTNISGGQLIVLSPITSIFLFEISGCYKSLELRSFWIRESFISAKKKKIILGSFHVLSLFSFLWYRRRMIHCCQLCIKRHIEPTIFPAPLYQVSPANTIQFNQDACLRVGILTAKFNLFCTCLIYILTSVPPLADKVSLQIPQFVR